MKFNLNLFKQSTYNKGFWKHMIGEGNDVIPQLSSSAGSLSLSCQQRAAQVYSSFKDMS